MTTSFLITGLPRSRTAWLATACNQQSNAICHHEPLAKAQRWEDCLRMWDISPYQFTGISDSSMGLHLTEILRDYQPNTLVILRRQSDVYSSLRGIGVDAQGYLEVLSARIACCLRHPLVMTVGFDELHDPLKAGQCLEWLMPGVRVDWEKLDQLCRVNVQADPAEMHRVAANRDAAALLGADVLTEIEIVERGRNVITA